MYQTSKTQSIFREVADEDVFYALFSDSPVSLELINHVRGIAGCSGHETRNTVDATRFLLCYGSAGNSVTTKVSGIPSRPSGIDWPVDAIGLPMVFLFQIIFPPSVVEQAEYPGDVLLVFARSSTKRGVGLFINPCEDYDSLVFEWHSTPITNPLTDVSYSDVAKKLSLNCARKLPECYALNFPTFDYIDSGKVESAIKDALPKNWIPKSAVMQRLLLKAFAQQPGMKIGGVPFWNTPPEEAINGRFIGSFWGVRPMYDVRWPWCNIESPLAGMSSRTKSTYLSFRDGGCINLFWDGANIDWYIEYF